jgi:hypothetical protein
LDLSRSDATDLAANGEADGAVTGSVSATAEEMKAAGKFYDPVTYEGAEPGSTVVPSHGSPANLAGILKTRIVVVGLRMWESLQRFPSLPLVPGVICRPLGCEWLWY